MLFLYKFELVQVDPPPSGPFRVEVQSEDGEVLATMDRLPMIATASRPLLQETLCLCWTAGEEGTAKGRWTVGGETAVGARWVELEGSGRRVYMSWEVTPQESGSAFKRRLSTMLVESGAAAVEESGRATPTESILTPPTEETPLLRQPSFASQQSSVAPLKSSAVKFNFQERKHSALDPKLLEQNQNDEVYYLPESSGEVEPPQTAEEAQQFVVMQFPDCRVSGEGEENAAPVEVVAEGPKVTYDYYARSTQVPLPAGKAYANLYTILSPALVVSDNLPNVRTVAQSRSRESRGTNWENHGNRNRITWAKGSALASIQVSHQTKEKTCTVKEAEQSLGSFASQRVTMLDTEAGRTIRENHMEALQVLKDNAFRQLCKKQVVYTK